MQLTEQYKNIQDLANANGVKFVESYRYPLHQKKVTLLFFGDSPSLMVASYQHSVTKECWTEYSLFVDAGWKQINEEVFMSVFHERVRKAKVNV